MQKAIKSKKAKKAKKNLGVKYWKQGFKKGKLKKDKKRLKKGLWDSKRVLYLHPETITTEQSGIGFREVLRGNIE